MNVLNIVAVALVALGAVGLGLWWRSRAAAVTQMSAPPSFRPVSDEPPGLRSALECVRVGRSYEHVRFKNVLVNTDAPVEAFLFDYVGRRAGAVGLSFTTNLLVLQTLLLVRKREAHIPAFCVKPQTLWGSLAVATGRAGSLPSTGWSRTGFHVTGQNFDRLIAFLTQPSVQDLVHAYPWRTIEGAGSTLAFFRRERVIRVGDLEPFLTNSMHLARRLLDEYAVGSEAPDQELESSI